VVDYTNELAAARKAAASALEYLRGAYEAFSPMKDAPATISTEADRTSQELIFASLASDFPDDALCGEETTANPSANKPNASRVWVIDPIDGTRGFVMKNGEFSVMVGLRVGNEVVVGVVAEPAFSRTTYAAKGQGCWVQVNDGVPQRCAVKSVANLAECTLVQSHAKKGPTPHSLKIAPKQILETYSAGVKMAMVARGEADIYVNTYANFHDWDICAGDLLVTEAGGQTSQISGEPLVYGILPSYSQRGGLIADNGAIHPNAVATLAPAAAELLRE
jgi:3'(2'), 5'-bisphosphate nucleotidase